MNKTLRCSIALLAATLISCALFATLGQLIVPLHRDDALSHPSIAIHFVPLMKDRHTPPQPAQPAQPVQPAAVAANRAATYNEQNPRSAPITIPRNAPRQEETRQSHESPPTAALSKVPFTPQAIPASQAIPPTEPVLVAKRTKQAKSVPAFIQPTIKVEPIYPMFAIRRGIEGWVAIDFVIAADGTVVAPKVTASEPPGVFTHTALRAVSQWRYPPGDKAQSSVRIQFKLQP